MESLFLKISVDWNESTRFRAVLGAAIAAGPLIGLKVVKGLLEAGSCVVSLEGEEAAKSFVMRLEREIGVTLASDFLHDEPLNLFALQNHTPGPWRMGETDQQGDYVACKSIVDAENRPVIQPSRGTARLLFRNPADIRLVTRAPVLLEELRKAVGA